MSGRPARRTTIDTESAPDAHAGVAVPDDPSGADRRLGISYGTGLVVAALEIRAGCWWDRG